MLKTFTQKRQINKLHKSILSICIDLWGKVDADGYINYLLGLLVYRFLSEKTEDRVTALLNDQPVPYEKAWENDGRREELKKELFQSLGYIIEPQYLFRKMADTVHSSGGIDIGFLKWAVSSLRESSAHQKSQALVDEVFKDMDLNSSKLGRSVAERTELISKAVLQIAGIDFKITDSETDMQEVYRMLIRRFTANEEKYSSTISSAKVGEMVARNTKFRM